MKCPFCGSENVRVQGKRGDWRTRICLDCRWTFQTFERVIMTAETALEIKEGEE